MARTGRSFATAAEDGEDIPRPKLDPELRERGSPVRIGAVGRVRDGKDGMELFRPRGCARSQGA